MTMSRLKKLYLVARGLPKTLLFNFRYFPFRTAIRLPVLVSHRVWFMRLAGEVGIADLRTGAVRIGFGEIGIFDQHRSRTIWQVDGRVEFRGRADLGHGSKICVTGTLIIGDGVSISAESAIVAARRICIGDKVVISWDVLIMDTDQHRLYDARGDEINAAKPVTIGNDVWIGCRSLVLKGVEIADGVVIAAASTLTRSVESPNVIAGGHPARVLRENISWRV
jgi:acetyltransferase-like isoleucine patch superfamily enzyme